MTLIHGLRFDNLRGDIYGGLTAAVVALPLALAFGVASGAGPVAGLYGAIFVGFFAALFGGTPSQVSGPTGPMTVVMAGVITQYSHEPAMAFTVVMLAGVFQIMFGLFKLGRYISLVPFPVISGFMSGIGCIIIILQIGPLIGHATPSGGTLVVLSKLPDLLTSPGRDAMIVGLLALGLVYLIPVRISRIVPAPLVALVLGTVAVLFLLPDAPAGTLALTVALSYLLGSIPFGLVLTRLAGLGDVRQIGSGNIGATNVLRTGNRVLAALTMVLDSGKGAAAALVAHGVAPDLAPFAALAAVLGHMFPVWLRFQGGKGVAAAAGVYLALSWPVGLCTLGVWLAVLLATRISSLSALVAALLSPLFAWYFAGPDVTAVAAILAVLVILRHKDNIGRLRRGAEAKIGAGKK